MPIKSLLRVLPPPKRTKQLLSDATWAKAEQELETVLPKDWRDFCAHYGSGTIGRFVFIANPAEAAARKWILDQLADYRQEKQRAPADKQFYYEYDPFPAPAGVLPFGQTDQRQTFYYVTRGQPDRWPLVIRDADTRFWHEHELALTKFLTTLLQGGSLEPFEEGWGDTTEPLTFRP
jgi:SMI1-KNR4 cell-wall